MGRKNLAAVWVEAELGKGVPDRMSSSKPRVIFVETDPPPYELSAVGECQRPVASWEVPAGGWVGVFEEAWGDQLLRAIARTIDRFQLEVWQPDTRADREYQHIFEDGVKHRLLPAHWSVLRHTSKVGAGPVRKISCPVILQRIANLNSDSLLHLTNISNAMSGEILSRLSLQHLPVLVQNYESKPYSVLARSGQHLARRMLYWWKGKRQRQWLAKVDHIVVPRQADKEILTEVYAGPIDLSTMGIDFAYWRPGDKAAARRTLDLPADRWVLLTASILRPKKQVDKLIQVLVQLEPEFDKLFCLVVGHGEPGYEAYLKRLAEPLLEKGKARFLGRVDDETLLRAYQSADLFVSVSRSEGGPGSVIKAFACGIPAFSTAVGDVADFMEEQGTGVLVPDVPQVWAARLKRILTGEKVSLISRSPAQQRYDWSVVAARFTAIYGQLFGRYGVSVEDS